jgi:hypothetical protein
MKKRIHVNKHILASNRKHGKNDPPLTCKTYKANHKGYEVEIYGYAKVVYRPEKPLSCGAVVWIETESPVCIDGELDLT